MDASAAVVPTPPSSTIVPLDDGRVVEVHTGGALEGPVLVFHHGTPGCGRPLGLLDDACRRHGFRWIGPARPGYGRSTRRPGHTVADVADDTAAVLDRLGVHRYLVAGWSGGGSAALACAARSSGPRVDAALVIAGCAPYPAPGLDWFAGLAPSEADEARNALAGEDELRRTLASSAASMGTITGPQLLAAPAPWRTDADARSLAVIADDMAANFRTALAPGPDGWIDDWLCQVRPWGFDLAAVHVPTAFWHGALDRLSPVAHTVWMHQRIEGARAHLEPHDGHVSIVVDHLDTMLRELGDLARAW